MSEILKDNAFVLKTYDFGESSLVAVALTRRHGKVRLLAKGARRSRSSFFGGLRTGNLVEVVFYHRGERELQLLKEVSIRTVFGSGGEGLERNCILQAGLEVVDRSVIGREADERMFDILEGFTSMIGSAADPWTVFFAMEVQLLETLGSYPSASRCDGCNRPLEEGDYGMDPESGSVSCGICRREGVPPLSRASCELLSMVARNGYRDLRNVRLGAGERREIGRLLHLLFLYHIDGYRLPRSLNFLKGVNRG